MKLKSQQKDRPLSPLEIFWRFAQDTLLTAGIFAILVLVTLGLKYLAELMKESELHYKVLVFLEYSIFLCGTLVVLMVLLYVTTITATDLVRSFRHAIMAPPSEEIPPIPLPGNTEQTPGTIQTAPQ